MGDESGTLEGKSLSNLRVVDLKMELEKRGLSKSGSKKELVKRLKQKLELEKLYEESSAIGESEPKLQLDEATEQNEFVKQYLAEQQKIYARQKEVRRLIELREKEESGGTDDSDSGLKDQDSDVSEGLSKSTCDSSAFVEGDGYDEKEQVSEAQTSASEVMSAPVVEPVSSNQENPCDSTNSPNQPTHGKTEPSFVSTEMDSQSKDTISFSLLDIKLPESPKRLSGMSGSKSPRNKADKLPHKDNSQQEADSLAGEKETFKTNGSVPKTSRSRSRWSDTKKTPSAESESTKHTEQKSTLATKTATPAEKLEKENLSEEDVSLGNTDKETERQMHSSHKLESRTLLQDSEPVSSELVQQTEVFTASNRKNENEKKIKESKFPEQVLEVSESSASKEKHHLKADDAEMKKDSIDVSHVGKRSGSDGEIVDTSERSRQKLKRGESPFKSKKLKRRSSSSSGSSASSRSSSPEVRNNTNQRTKLSRRPEKRGNRSPEEKANRSPKSKYGHGFTRWGQDQDARQRKDPKARSKIDFDISRSRGLERNRRSSSEASSSPGASRSRSPEASRSSSSGGSRSRSRSLGASQSRSPEISQSSDLKASENSNLMAKRSQGPKSKQRPSPKPKRSVSPRRKGSVSPKCKGSVSPKRKGSVSPKHKGSVSPKRKGSVSPKRKRSISPKRKRSVSPKHKRSVNLKHKKSVSPKRKRSVSPKRKRSVSPKRKRSVSPKRKRSVSPKRKRSVSPKHKGSLSSKHKYSASFIHKRSASPVRKRSASPVHKRSASPVHKRSASPVHKRSASPVHKRSASPVLKRSASPVLRRSTSPVHRRSTSPVHRRSTSPIHRRSTSPVQKRSTSPIQKRSTSPVQKRSTSPVQKRSQSPVQKRSESPVHKRTTSPIHKRDASPTHKGSVSPTRKISTSPVYKKSASPECRPSVFPKRKWSESPLPKDSISSTTMQKNRSKIRRSVSSERGQKPSPEHGQSLSPQREQSPVPRRRNRSSSSEDSQDKNSEAISDRKAKVESERSSCDSSSVSSDSDQRESKRAISVRKDMLKAKQMLDKEASESVSEKKIEQIPRQPKRPKLNRNSFSDTMAQQMDLKNKEAASAIQRVKSVEEKASVASKDAPTTSGDKSLSETAVPPEIPPEKISYRKLNMPFKKNEDKDKNLGRKRRWRSSSNMLQNTVMNISSDSLKNLIPDFKLTHTPVTPKESEEIPPKIMKESDDLNDKEENGSAVASTNNEDIAPKVKKAEVVALKPTKADKTRSSKTNESSTSEDASKEKQKQARRCLEATPSCSAFANALKAFTSSKKSVKKAVPHPQIKEEDTPRKDVEKKKLLVQHPEPPKPTSRIIFVQNLVRPFTLTQLKNLLNQTGKVVEESFWIDKIKSRCFVKYETEEEAIKTKEALHDARWPPSNPKILSVDFATQDEFDRHSRGYDVPMPPAALAHQSEVPRKREELPTRDLTDLRKKRLERHSREKEHSKPSVTYVREWDKDKLTQESPERERIRPPPKERPRSTERRKDSKRDSKKKSIEDTPAKLLDDLFQKTKSIPSIYWLPLTEEQVKQREDERRQRRLDRERRNQEEREAERRTKRKPREKQPRSRSRSRQRQDRRR